jgi:hypothetical protein
MLRNVGACSMARDGGSGTRQCSAGIPRELVILSRPCLNSTQALYQKKKNPPRPRCLETVIGPNARWSLFLPSILRVFWPMYEFRLSLNLKISDCATTTSAPGKVDKFQPSLEALHNLFRSLHNLYTQQDIITDSCSPTFRQIKKRLA